MQFSKIKKLNKAELLKNEGKYKEALRILNNLEEKDIKTIFELKKKEPQKNK
jgi:hypothetical protein